MRRGSCPTTALKLNDYKTWYFIMGTEASKSSPWLKVYDCECSLLFNFKHFKTCHETYQILWTCNNQLLTVSQSEGHFFRTRTAGRSALLRRLTAPGYLPRALGMCRGTNFALLPFRLDVGFLSYRRSGDFPASVPHIFGIKLAVLSGVFVLSAAIVWGWVDDIALVSWRLRYHLKW